MADSEQLREAMAACLDREASWVEFYQDNMRDGSPAVAGPDAHLKMLTQIATAEAQFGEALWNRNYEDAAQVLGASLDLGFEISQSTGAWLALWLGFALEVSGDQAQAQECYARAHGNQPNIPRPKPAAGQASQDLPEQVLKVASQMRIGFPNPATVEIPKTLVGDIAPLQGSGTTGQTEEALRALGQYLGVTAIRPEKEVGTGPDVLWINETEYAICMEVKTDKEPTSKYRKSDLGQLRDHIQWVRDNYPSAKIIPCFVGPVLPASSASNPSADIIVVELSQFQILSQKLLGALRDVSQRAVPLSLGLELGQVMEERGLLYPAVFHTLDAVHLREVPRPV